MLRRQSVIILILLIGTLLPYSSIKAQKQDSGHIHSPKKAIILSALLPGAGQFYNKKYWKIPVIYAAAGTFFYFTSTNNSLYLQFRNGFRYISDTSNHATTAIVNGIEFTGPQCQTNRDAFKKLRDLNFFGICLVYALNIIDANVDAHLFDFNKHENISFYPSYFHGGLSFHCIKYF